MALDASPREILCEALTRRPGESFERSLGRAIRRHHGEYADYIAVISRIREIAASRRLDLWQAAELLTRQP